MPTDYIPKRDTELSIWLGNFITVAQANITLLAFLPADLMNLSNDNATFTGDVAQLNTAKVQMKSATQNKNTARKKAVADAPRPRPPRAEQSRRDARAEIQPRTEPENHQTRRRCACHAHRPCGKRRVQWRERTAMEPQR